MSQKDRVTIAFMSHAGQLERYGFIAEQLRELYQVKTVLWTLGGIDFDRGRVACGFDEVVDLLEGFQRSQHIPVDVHRENLLALRAVERRCGGNFYHQDAALDRSLTGHTNSEVDYERIRNRWSHAEIASMSVCLASAVEGELDRRDVRLVVGESNTLPYRLVYRLLKARGIMKVYPNGLPHVGERIYFDPSLDASWPRCIARYREMRDTGIPADIRAEAKEILEELRTRHVKPYYFQRFKRGSRSWRQRLSVSRLIAGIRESRRAALPRMQSNPRAVPPEILSLRARILRAVSLRRRQLYYERVTCRESPTPPYALYLFHVQPEVTVEGLAFEYQDQVALVRNIVACLPADIPLVVKEHKTEAGRRPIEYYGEIMSIPNVVLVHDTLDSMDLVKQATVAITLTGTIALEALCVGVPAVTLGSIYYDQFPGVYRARSIAELRDLLAEPSELAPATLDDALLIIAARIAACHNGAYPGPPGDRENARLLAKALVCEAELSGVQLT